VRGAFTGATAAKRWKFELADGATLFLDEVGDMSQRVQAKVLRVLEEQRFSPVGSNALVRVDVRAIAATNKQLEMEIERGNFRPDLFYRLNVIPFEVPPLRDRLEDIPALVEHFNEKFSRAYGKSPKRFETDAVEALQNYTWAGNVRELRNTVERVCIMHAKQKVTASDLPPLGGDEPAPAPTKFSSFKEASEAHQRDFIRAKLAEAEGNVTRAAELMGIDRSHLYRRMRALGIRVRGERENGN
jgi:two-component system, NtrC family, nitrogen regulation response regulator NtrX